MYLIELTLDPLKIVQDTSETTFSDIIKELGAVNIDGLLVSHWENHSPKSCVWSLVVEFNCSNIVACSATLAAYMKEGLVKWFKVRQARKGKWG